MIRRIGLAVIALVAACERPSSDQEGGRSRSTLSENAVRATPGYVVDSMHPPAEALRRFRVGIDSVGGFAGPTTRDALVKRFFAALESRDARALHSLGVTKAEYAWVIYPGSQFSRPPIYQPPDIAWLLLQSSSTTGFNRVLQRLGGGQVQYAGHQCDAAEMDGRISVFAKCWVRVSVAGEFANRRLFGTIVEHNGRFKFLGFANEF